MKNEKLKQKDITNYKFPVSMQFKKCFFFGGGGGAKIIYSL
jgi:hypothetical protein